MSFLFKKYSLVKVIYLSSCETHIILIEMMYVNKQNTYTSNTQKKVTLERVS